MWKLFSRAVLVACASLLAACAGDPLPPSRSPSDPANPHAPEAPFTAPALAASIEALPADSSPATSMNDHGAHASADAGVTYTCPMHPEVQASEPGRCPKCGMTLVPKKP